MSISTGKPLVMTASMKVIRPVTFPKNDFAVGELRGEQEWKRLPVFFFRNGRGRQARGVSMATTKS